MPAPKLKLYFTNISKPHPQEPVPPDLSEFFSPTKFPHPETYRKWMSHQSWEANSHIEISLPALPPFGDVLPFIPRALLQEPRPSMSILHSYFHFLRVLLLLFLHFCRTPPFLWVLQLSLVGTPLPQKSFFLPLPVLPPTPVPCSWAELPSPVGWPETPCALVQVLLTHWILCLVLHSVLWWRLEEPPLPFGMIIY